MSTGAGKTTWGYAVAAAVLLCAAPYLAGGPYRVHILNMICLQAILALGLNLAMGYAGQPNYAIGALYGVGAYTSALLSLRLGWSFPMALLGAVAMCAVTSGLVGVPSLKAQMQYLAIITIGLGTLINAILMNWHSLTNGPIGISAIPPIRLFGRAFTTEVQVYWVIMPICVVLYLGASRLVASEVGFRFRAIRDDIVVARASGIVAPVYQVLAFALSGACAGIAGSLYAHISSYISPDGFTFTQTLFVMCCMFVGGMGRMWGPLIGVVMLTVAQEYLRALEEFQWIVYGAVIMLLVVFLPGGIFSLGPKLREHGRRRRGAAAGTAEGGRA